MKLHDLEYFQYLANSQSFTKTAEHFYVSQPSISMALKRLEKEFDTTLILRDRSVRSIQLTKTGKILYDYSITILNMIDKTKRAINDSKSKTVYLGFLPTIAGHFLPKLYPYISKYKTSIKMIEEESSDAMFDLIKDKKVPIAIIGSDEKTFDEDWATQIPIAERSLDICVSPGHPLAKHDKLDVSMLKDTSFVSLSKGYTHHRIFNHWANQNQLNFSNLQYIDEIQTVNSMVASGMSASLMADFLVHGRADILQIPLENAPKFYVSLLINNDAEFNEIQKDFNNKLIEAIKETF